jgi:hypothetical protein
MLIMRKRDQVKEQHERAVADQLLEALKIDATFERSGDPDKREPDVIYKIGRKTVGIEVTTAYYEASDAKDAAEIAAGEEPLRRDEIRSRSEGVMGSPDQMICDSVQAAIDTKCSKTYVGTDETWLCIGLDAALSDAESVDECVDHLKIPKKPPFDKIYVTYTAPTHEVGGQKSIRLY